jgi:hypothetical protein
MSELTKLRRQLPPMLRALDVGIPAGFLFDYLHTPIPWMIGPMIAVAAFNLMGVRIYSPPYARKKPADLFDNSYVDQLSKSGFLKELWGSELR